MADNKYLALLEEQKDTIASYLPSYLRTDDERDRFFANARAVADNYLLKNCTPDSLLRCVVDAAKRGLMVGGPEKHCAVVPFKTKSGSEIGQLIVQWQGKSFLWQRAGAIKKLKAQVVYDGDDFQLVEGDEDRIEHRPDFKADRSPSWLNDLNNIVGAYAIAWLPNGEAVHQFVSKSSLRRTMEAVKKKNDGKLGFGWNDWLPEMCRKTAIHRLDGLIQPQPAMSAEQKEAWALNEKVVGEFADTVGDRPDDIPTATDGTPAPTPRRASSVEVVKQGASGKQKSSPASTDAPPDRLFTDEEQNDCYESWAALGGKATQLKKFLEANFGVDDLAKLNLSQMDELQSKMQETLAA